MQARGCPAGERLPVTACVDIGSFLLQLLLRRHPEWHDRPAAVVSEDKPLGIVVSVNRPARDAGVRVGMRYAAALSLAAHLQAGTVGPGKVAAGVELIIDRLLSISPFVEGAGSGADAEPDAVFAEPGVFWLDVSGLQRHHRSPAELARTIRSRLGELRFDATVVIGYTRIGTFLLARDARRGWLVARDAAAERNAARQAPLERLPLAPEARDLLEKLDVTTVDAFLRLPYAEVLRRFGGDAAAVHRSVRSELELPVQGDVPASPFLHRRRLSHAETDAGRLQRHVDALLDALLDRLRKEDRAVAALHLRLLLEDGSHHHEMIRPAAPTCERRPLVDLIELRLRALDLSAGVDELAVDADRAVAALHLRLLLEDGSHHHEMIRPAAPTCERRPLVDLIELRLRALDLSAGVDELAVDAEHVRAHADQATLFRTLRERDPAAGSEALARIRAQFGNHAVVHAVLSDEHLPEAQFRWQPVAEVVLPRPDACRGREPTATGWLVRRMLRQPAEVPPPRSAACGPFLISVGWWHVRGARLTEGVDRAYYIVRSRNGALEWIYRDRLTGRWYLQGWVE